MQKGATTEPEARTSQDIRYIQHVCCSIYPGLGGVFKPLQLALNATKLSLSVDLQKRVRNAWDFILENNLCLPLKELVVYHLQVD